MRITRELTIKRTEPTTIIVPDLQENSVIPTKIYLDNPSFYLNLSFGSIKINLSPGYLSLCSMIDLSDYSRTLMTTKVSDYRLTLTNKTKYEQRVTITIEYVKHAGVMLYEGSYNENEIPKCLDSFAGYGVLRMVIGSATIDEDIKGVKFKCIYRGLYDDFEQLNETDSTAIDVIIPDKYQKVLHFFELVPLNPKVKNINLICYGYNVAN